MESATKLQLAAVSGVILIAILGLAVYFKPTNPLGSSSTTTVTPQCALSPLGSTLYIRVVSQSGNVVPADVTMDASPVETCDGRTATIEVLYHPTLNASGVASFDASYATFISLTVHYQDKNYTFRADVHNSTTTCANLDVPSGVSTVAPCK